MGNPIKIVIPGAPITKKNSQRIIKTKGRHIPIPSKQFAEYQELAGLYIPLSARRMLSERFNVKAVYYMPTRRKVDLVNLLEATCDILVHYRVIEDDNSKIVVSHDGSRVKYDKENPRTEITIEEAE